MKTRQNTEFHPCDSNHESAHCTGFEPSLADSQLGVLTKTPRTPYEKKRKKKRQRLSS